MSSFDRDQILRGIAEIATTRLDRSFEEVTPDSALVEDLELDSIELLTLAVEVEDRFCVILEPNDEASLRTVGDLVRAIEIKKQQPDG